MLNRVWLPWYTSSVVLGRPQADTSGRGAASRVIERPTFGFDNSFDDSFFGGGTFGSSDTVGSNTVSTDTASGDYGD